MAVVCSVQLLFVVCSRFQVCSGVSHCMLTCNCPGTTSARAGRRVAGPVLWPPPTGTSSMRTECSDCLGENSKTFFLFFISQALSRAAFIPFNTFVCNDIIITSKNIRIRQLRVSNLSCEVHPDFQSAIRHCYNEYEVSKEDHEGFGPGYREKTQPEAWLYRSPEELGTTQMLFGGKVSGDGVL